MNAHDLGQAQCTSIGAKGSTPSIDIKLDKKIYSAVVDTGASVSLIAEKLVDKYPIKHNRLTVVDANNQPINIIGEIDITVKTPDEMLTDSMLVVGNNSKVTIDLLLGMNLLKYANLDFPRGQIQFRKERTSAEPPIKNPEGIYIELLGTTMKTEKQKGKILQAKQESISQEENEINLHLTHDIEIDPNTVTVMAIKAPAWCKEGTYLTLHTTEHKKKQLVTANIVTKVDRGRLNINVISFNDKPVKLTQGTMLCLANVDNNEALNIVTSVTEDDQQPVTTGTDEVQRPLRPLTKNDICCEDESMTDDVLSLVNKYRNNCWLPGETLGLYKGDQLEIELRDPTVVVNKAPYRIHHAQKEPLNKVIKGMLKDGIIKRSKSVFNSPLIIVSKKNGEIRPCIDFRELNSVTKPVTYPIPRISDLLNSIGTDSLVISSLDLASAYHQCSILEQDRPKTAFTVENSKYEFTRVPFGLTSAPSFFSRIINTVLHDEIGLNTICYMDDILVMSPDKESHMKKLESVLQKLNKANLKLKIQKCRLFTERVPFLGFQLTSKGLTMDNDRQSVIRNLPNPTSKKEVMALLGLTNYYRQFVRNYADITRPLCDLLRKGSNFKWTDKHTQAVTKLKTELCKPTILKFPDYSKSFHIQSDASLKGISACLLQEHAGKLHPVSYISKGLTDTQQQYSATKREALALLFALTKYQYIIRYYKVEAYTDHRPLLGLITKPTKDAALTRWCLSIQEYNIILHYLPGSANYFADTLSRLVDIRNGCEEVTQVMEDKLLQKISMITEEEVTEKEMSNQSQFDSLVPIKVPWSEKELRKEQQDDEQCKKLRKSMKENAKENTSKLSSFRVYNNVLYVHRTLKRSSSTEELLVPYIPDKLMERAFKIIHNDITSGHKNAERTIKLFRRNFYNGQEAKYIKEKCHQCPLCIQAKGLPKPVPISKYPIPHKPFTTVSSDILGPLPLTQNGNKYVVTFRDFTTRYAIFYPIPYKDSDEIIRALRQTIAHYGSFRTLLTDNAPEYKSEKLRKFCAFYNIKKREIVPYHPSSQGLAERLNREIAKLLRIYVQDLSVTDWDELLPTLQLTINTTFNATIQDSPFYALYGYESPTTEITTHKHDYGEDYLSGHLNRVSKIRQHCRKHLLRNQDQYTARTNNARKEKTINIGDRVYANLRNRTPQSKINLPIAGPFLVTGTRGKGVTIENQVTNEDYLVHPDTLITGINPTQSEPKQVITPQSVEDQVTPDPLTLTNNDSQLKGKASTPSAESDTNTPRYHPRYNLRPLNNKTS